MPSKLNELKKEIQRLRPEIVISYPEMLPPIVRPITLEDVLAVFDGKIRDLENVGEYLQTWKLENGNHNLFNFWLLGKPLDDQSEETINFLFDLICK